MLPRDDERALEHSTDELVIVLEEEVNDVAEQAKAVTSAGVEIVDRNETLNMALARIEQDDSASELERLENKESVKFAGPNVRNPPPLKNRGDQVEGGDTSAGIVPSIVNAPAAWDTTRGDADITIAICDSGIKYDHAGLAANMEESVDNHGYDFINDDPDPYPRTFTDAGDKRIEEHGTQTAGIVAKICDCSLLSIKVADWMTGDGWHSGWATVNGVEWAASNGADIILVNVQSSEGEWPPFDEAVSYAESAGAITIAPAGNAGTEYDEVRYASQCHIAVSTLRLTDPQSPEIEDEETLADFSNYGEFVDVVAPGIATRTTYPAAGGEPADEYSGFAGTSVSAPAVAGIAGLVVSVDDALSIDELREIIEETARDVGLPDVKQGDGLVDAESAVRRADTPTAGGMVGVNDGTVTNLYWDRPLHVQN